MEAIRRLFSPEFRNRLDAVIQFGALDQDTIERVVDKLLVEAEAQLEQKRVSISVDEAARRWIAKRGYDPKMGARPMARIIQEHIKRPLAEELLFGKLVNGGHVDVTVERGRREAQARHPLGERAGALIARKSRNLNSRRPGAALEVSGRGRRCGPWSSHRASFRR